MELCNVTEWKYKAEGNRHIVVCNGKGKVLRLLKKFNSNSYPFDISSDSPANKKFRCNDEKLDELHFVESVVLPLINFCDACHVPKVVKVSESFLRELDQNIKADRPKHRWHKSLEYTAPALLMQDHCFIPFTSCHKSLIDNGAIANPDVLTVEIKLKKGFIGSSQASELPGILNGPICQFCHTQIFRVLEEERYKKCSFYCPLDLFSGDQHRMKSALMSLFFAPQNNLRLFRNGNLIFSQEILDALNTTEKLNRATTIICDLVETLIDSLSWNSTSNRGSAIEMLTDVISRVLLLPVSTKTKTTTSQGQYCHGAFYKEKLCKQKRNSLFKHPGNNCKVQSTSQPLPASCILNIILSQQKLQTLALPDIHRKYQKVNSSLFSKVKVKEDLCIDAPYTSTSWKHLVNSQNGRKDTKKKDAMCEIAHQLRQFLVAKSFSDCSVMISLQKLKESTGMAQVLASAGKPKAPTAMFNVVQDSVGDYYFVSIAVVDTDPKMSSKIPEYYKRHLELTKWWRNIMDKT